MKLPRTTATDAATLVAQWAEAGRMMARMRREALASQSEDESRLAAWDMLQLGGMLPEESRRVSTSGLIEMQTLFAKLARRG